MQSGWRGHVIAFSLALALGFGTGLYAGTIFSNSSQSTRDVTDLAQGYRYINPILFCSDKELSHSTSALSRSIECKVKEFIDAQKIAGTLTEATVYYRDLNGGPWAIVNPEIRSTPASLLKVPLAMSVYRRVERDPSFLHTSLPVTQPEQNNDTYFRPSSTAVPGTTHSVEQLVDLSLIHSDNNATTLLISQLTDAELRKSYQDLGIDVPIDDPTNFTLSVRTYASFFRILFNASYISRELSESVLSKLVQSEFTQGLVRGVPNSVRIAHKFGEYRIDEHHVQLHDCGIVYRPGSPYLVCVMTQGKSFEELADVIAEISRIVWHEQGQ